MNEVEKLRERLADLLSFEELVLPNDDDDDGDDERSESVDRYQTGFDAGYKAALRTVLEEIGRDQANSE